jgi:hypothetical protein
MRNRASIVGAPRGDLIDALGNYFLTVMWSLPVATVFLKVNGGWAIVIRDWWA